MDYKKIYNNLIERAKQREINFYVEKHHIIPRCLGGKDIDENLVSLTPEEHYLAHQLLVKIYPENKSLIYAANMMIPNRPNNKMYGWLRRKYSETVSENQRGKGNSQFGTFWITDGVNSKKIKKNEDIPNGWYKGRTIIQLKFHNITKCNDCIKTENAYYYYNMFINGNYSSLRQFAKSEECDISQPALSKMFKKYIKEYDAKEGKSYSPIAQR